ncbi:MAG: DUF1501 domain-containing protein [Chloroflexi bacterium]|nr:DUF1501 domain-containing protein [Chloroflexota bacterium]MCH8350937.1 DUF1501 domain-containing protein [Chloroflexota bacterium]MCI0779717.1 DUF1501 domain-containing protein [Chloroflexota bacterium]MCI0784741.1 DUF1501 domain-containing protein [Chloroflexota bacterium]MCI0792107.1 DUF1501 domain-containing protein [Chloroflexota bacterium]
MGTTQEDRVLVVVQLTGGNDFMNTVVPYTSEHYYDARKKIVIDQDQVLPINGQLGFNNNAAPLKRLYDEGKMAIIQGIGYPDSNRSHFRGMDIWHTCEPDRVGLDGWLGLAVRELDPDSENVLTGVNIGRGLPRAMAVTGVPVTSIGDLEGYGVMADLEREQLRDKAIETFKNIYGQAIGAGPVAEYIGKTGIDVLKGADLLADVAAKYESPVEYADNPIAKSLRDVARIHLAGLGTRIFYTAHGGYDHHANQMTAHPKQMDELSGAVADFIDDLEQHDAGDNVAVLVFTEFGRRMRDNGSGTDHGSGGGAFLIGNKVEGGLYAEYPPLNPADWEHGEDLRHTIDFRGVYGTVLEQWIDVEARPIVKGNFEQIHPFKT